MAPKPQHWRLTSRQRVISSLSFDQLLAFQTVTRLNSFSAAATELSLTQPAISQRMKHLERILGCSLFERKNGAHAELTPAGHEVAAFADQVLTYTDDFRDRLGRIAHDANETTLTIYSGSDHIKYLLTTAVIKMRRLEPTIHIRIRHLSSTESIVNELAHGDADLGICRAPVSSDVRVLCRLSERLELFANPNDPIISVDQSEVTQYIASSNLALFAPGMRSRENVDRWADQFGITLNPVLEARNIEAMRTYVTQGLALSILPRMCVDDDIRNQRIVSVPAPGLPLNRPIAVISQRDGAVPHKVRRFLDALPYEEYVLEAAFK